MNRKIIEDIKVRKKVKFDHQYSDDIVVKKKIKKKKFSHRKLSRNPKLLNNQKNISNFIIILFFLSIVIGLGFWGSVFFKNTSIIIIKKQQLFSLNKNSFKASKKLQAEIPFEVMIINDNKSEDITLSESKKISQKAKGEIIIYNKNSRRKNTYLKILIYLMKTAKSI